MSTGDRGNVRVDKALLAYARAAAKEDNVDVWTWVERVISKELSRRLMQKLKETALNERGGV